MRVWLACVALAGCGRIDFATTSDATADGRAGADSTVSSVSWVKTFIDASDTQTTNDDTFLAIADHAGDAIVFEVFCSTGGAIPTGVTVTSPGWTLDQLSPLVGTDSTDFFAVSFGTIAPDTHVASFQITWTSTPMCTSQNAMGDEFAGNDPTGGATTFDAHGEIDGMGNCVTALITQHADDALWVACEGNGTGGPELGFTQTDDDGDGDLAGYKLTTDPANTLETFSFPNVGPFLVTAVSIAPG